MSANKSFKSLSQEARVRVYWRIGNFNSPMSFRGRQEDGSELFQPVASNYQRRGDTLVFPPGSDRGEARQKREGQHRKSTENAPKQYGWAIGFDKDVLLVLSDDGRIHLHPPDKVVSELR